jgi:hypothetical protein
LLVVSSVEVLGLAVGVGLVVVLTVAFEKGVVRVAAGLGVVSDWWAKVEDQ